MTKIGRMIELLKPYEFTNVKTVRKELEEIQERIERANVITDYERAAFAAVSVTGELMSAVEGPK